MAFASELTVIQTGEMLLIQHVWACPRLASTPPGVITCLLNYTPTGNMFPFDLTEEVLSSSVRQ